MGEHLLVSPPSICDRAEIELAHRQMRVHRACRIERCAWKWVAYYTLVQHGRITPPASSPRERAYRRGIHFPVDDTKPCAGNTPELRTFQQVLDGLAQLALPQDHQASGCGQ